MVATTAGAIPEVVEDGGTGLLVPPDDPEALASAIAALLDNPELMRSMGLRGREKVVSDFTWEKVVERVIRGYHAIPGVV